MKILVISLDASDCILNNSSTYENLIAQNRILLDSIVDISTQYDRLTIFANSMRQDKEIDQKLSEETNQISFFSALEIIHEYLQNQLRDIHIDISLNKLLMADIYNNVPTGSTFDSHNDNDTYRYTYPDYNKATHVYAQVHNVFSTDPNADEVVIKFYDNDEKLLNVLTNFFQNHNYLLPRTTTLQLLIYSSSNGRDPSLCKEILGAGDSDTRYRETIIMFAKQCTPIKETKTRKHIDFANDINREHILSGMSFYNPLKTADCMSNIEISPKLSNHIDKNNYSELAKNVSMSGRLYMRSVSKPDCVDLSHGDPLHGPHSCIKDALSTMVKNIECYTPGDIEIPSEEKELITMHDYRWRYETHPILQKATFKEFSRLGIPVDEHINTETGDFNIMVGNGVTHLYAIGLLSMVNSGGKVLVPAPTYSLIPYTLEGIDQSINLILIETSECNDHKISARELKTALETHPDATCLMLVNPGNPTGNIYTHQDYEALAKVLLEYPHVWIIEDCIYDKIFLDPKQENLFSPFAAIEIDGKKMHDRTLTIKGFSKSDGMPKLRLGYATSGNDALIHRVRRHIFAETFSPSDVSQIIGAHILENTPYTYYKSINQEYRILRDCVIQWIAVLNHKMNHFFRTSGITYTYAYKPKAGFFIIIKFPGLFGLKLPNGEQLTKDYKLSEFLLSQNVHLINGSAHGFKKEEMAFRLTFSTRIHILTKGLLHIEKSILIILSANKAYIKETEQLFILPTQSIKPLNILVTFQPGHGHLEPLLGFSSELRNQGHYVSFVSSNTFSETVNKKGFNFYAAGLDWELTTLRETFTSLASISDMELAPYLMKVLLKKVSEQFVRDLLTIMKNVSPDVLICDHTDFGGRIAGEVMNVPVVIANLGIHFSPEICCAFLHTELSRLRTTFNLPSEQLEKTIYPSLILNFLPPEWFLGPSYNILPGDRFFSSYKCTGIGNSENLQEILLKLPHNPLVHASLGTILHNKSDIINKLISASIGKKWNLLITVGNEVDIGHEYPDLPKNVFVAPFIPHSELLPRCNVMITHCGPASIKAAIQHELPVLMLPLASDEYTIMTSALKLGIGITIKRALSANSYGELFVVPKALFATDIETAILSLLNEEIYRTNIRTCNEHLKAQMPTSEIEVLLSDVVAWNKLSHRIKPFIEQPDEQTDAILTELTCSMPEKKVKYKDITMLFICYLITKIKANEEFCHLIFRFHETFWGESGKLFNKDIRQRLQNILPDEVKQYMSFSDKGISKPPVKFGTFSSPITHINKIKFFPPTNNIDAKCVLPKEISIIIPVKNNQNGVVRLLESFVKYTSESYYPNSIIIVDNNSDVPLVIPDKYYNLSIDVILTSCNTPGPGAARNAGVNIAKTRESKWLLFIDSDCIMTTSTISGYIEHHRTAVAFQGSISPLGDDWLSNYYAKTKEIFYRNTTNNDNTSFIDPANALVLLSAFESINGFDTKFNPSGEDSDLSVRISEKGRIVYALDSHIKHDYLDGDNCVRNKHLISFIKRFKKYGKGYKLLCRKYGEFSISHNNKEHFDNATSWFYARGFCKNVSEILKLLRQNPEEPASEMSYTALKILMFKAHQSGDTREIQEAPLRSATVHDSHSNH